MTPAEAGQPEAAAGANAEVDAVAFVHTKKHVASEQADDVTVERFTNTKLNIALINDPKNGPRFTMTKRESGLDDHDEAAKPSDRSAPSAEKTDEKTGSSTPDLPPSTPRWSHAEEAAPSTTSSEVAAPSIAASHQVADTAAGTDQPHGGAAPAAALLAKPLPSGVPPAAQPPSKVPVDSSKTFVGHNGTYYDENWRWMDWRGTRRSWNWPAALSLGHWFAFRRLYSFAGLYLALLAGLAAATVNDIPILAVVVLTLVIVGLAGIYGNTLYFLAFRRAVDHVTKTGKGSYEELRSQLANAGGTSVLGLSVMAALSLIGIAATLAATYYLRGGFSLNLWPL